MKLVRPRNIIAGLMMFFAATWLGVVITDRRQLPYGAMVTELIHAKHLVNVLSEYARAHGNRFPTMLGQLPAGLVPSGEEYFHDPRTKEVAAWRYYGGYPVAAVGDDASGEMIVLASPNMIDARRRLVVHADGSGEFLGEDQYTRKISKQLNGERQ